VWYDRAARSTQIAPSNLLWSTLQLSTSPHPSRTYESVFCRPVEKTFRSTKNTCPPDASEPTFRFGKLNRKTATVFVDRSTKNTCGRQKTLPPASQAGPDRCLPAPGHWRVSPGHCPVSLSHCPASPGQCLDSLPCFAARAVPTRGPSRAASGPVFVPRAAITSRGEGETKEMLILR